MAVDALEQLVPLPRLVETDHVDLASPPGTVWERVRHGDLTQSPLVRALFALRTLPERLAGRHPGVRVRIDDLRSSPEQPGFQVLIDDPPREVAVGAIGQVWKPEIAFIHVPDAGAFAAFDEPGWIQVAWAVRVTAWSERATRLELELRVDATDEESWHRFRNYFRVIGPGSRFIRRSLLAGIARELGGARSEEDVRPMPGDDLLPDAIAQLDDGVTIDATPHEVWPWLVQMGCRRAGFYSIDVLDNAGRRSAREIHPELQSIQVGDVFPATPEGKEGFEVLAIDEPQALVLGILLDPEAGRQLSFCSPRPTDFVQVTWVFELQSVEPSRTRLRVRARASFSPSSRRRALWMAPVHRLMERAQLRHLAARVEGRVPPDDWRDVLAGVGGAAVAAFALLTPHRRGRRSHWGVTAEEAAGAHPGDDLIPEPDWSWTHAVVIEASAHDTWPWIAQIGADRGGFYSYQWLEHLFRADLVNAERVHPEWQLQRGDDLIIDPRLPALRITRIEPGHWFLAVDEGPHAAVSWLFLVEPTGENRCRLVSRLRCRASYDLATRLRYGPWLAEPIGFAMDRRMLLGVKERAERRAPGSGPARKTPT
jgi:hypothetical protein